MGFPPFIPADDPITRINRKLTGPSDSFLDGFDPGHFRNMIADVSFDSFAERHRRGRAAHARAVQPDADQPIGSDIDQFNIASIGLNRWADRVEDTGHATKDIRE